MANLPDRLEEIREKLRTFVRERDWEQFHDPKNLAMCLASEVGELVAEYRWVPGSKAIEITQDAPVRARVAAELGDVGIAWLLLCHRLDMDPLKVISDKLEMNRKAYPVEKSRGRSDKPS